MKNEIKAIIVDDEIRARRVLKRLLSKHCDNITLIGEANNIDDARVIIKENGPDIVFLDVELSHETGFDLLGEISKINFQTIFVTAHDDYAIKAIKWSAVDYVLKPIDPIELKAAVEKAINNSTRLSNQPSESIRKTDDNNIGIPTMEGLQFVLIDSIIRCEAKGAYTICHFNDKTSITSSKALQTYDQLLSPKGFFRIHKSHLINIAYIKEYIKGRGGNVIMSDGTTLAVALRKKEEFLKRILH